MGFKGASMHYIGIKPIHVFVFQQIGFWDYIACTYPKSCEERVKPSSTQYCWHMQLISAGYAYYHTLEGSVASNVAEYKAVHLVLSMTQIAVPLSKQIASFALLPLSLSMKAINVIEEALKVHLMPFFDWCNRMCLRLCLEWSILFFFFNIHRKAAQKAHMVYAISSQFEMHRTYVNLR